VDEVGCCVVADGEIFGFPASEGTGSGEE
jgi:hypothetical protein